MMTFYFDFFYFLGLASMATFFFSVPGGLLKAGRKYWVASTDAPSRRTFCTRYVSTRTSLRFFAPETDKDKAKELRIEWLLQETLPFCLSSFWALSSVIGSLALVFAVNWGAAGKQLKLAGISVTIYFLCFGIRFSTNRKLLNWAERQQTNGKEPDGQTKPKEMREMHLFPEDIENRMPY